MKKCQCCGWIDLPGSASACPNCGEASWVKTDAAPLLVDEASVAEDKPAKKSKGDKS